MGDKPRTKKFKGKASTADIKKQIANDSLDSPFLYVAENSGLDIQKSNLLNDPGYLIMDGYENFDIDKITLDSSKITENSNIIVILRYYEYLCTAKFNINYIVPMLQSGLKWNNIFDMVKHHLKMTLMLNVPSVDTIYELDMMYTGKIKY